MHKCALGNIGGLVVPCQRNVHKCANAQMQIQMHKCAQMCVGKHRRVGRAVSKSCRSCVPRGGPWGRGICHILPFFLDNVSIIHYFEAARGSDMCSE